ncbi:MAG: transcriptional repressor [Microthrixaceae bacterium]|nr:transcriptional repressor [Microthrixaceae bacterium]
MPTAGGDAHSQAEERLAAVDARYTSKRKALVEVFIRSKRPMTLPEVIAANASLAQSSVYRNLATLEAAGVIHRIVTSDDHARFELAEAISGHHHHHLICSMCGSIEDFTLHPRVESAVAREFAGVAERRGFTTNAHQMDLIGRCAECATAE